MGQYDLRKEIQPSSRKIYYINYGRAVFKLVQSVANKDEFYVFKLIAGSRRAAGFAKGKLRKELIEKIKKQNLNEVNA